MEENTFYSSNNTEALFSVSGETKSTKNEPEKIIVTTIEEAMYMRRKENENGI